MKKLLLVAVLGLLLFACSKEKETDKEIKVNYIADTQMYEFDLSGVSTTNTEYELKILSKSGSHVFSASFNANKFTWNGKTTDGNAVADGVYPFIIKNKDKTVNQDGFVYVLSKK